MFLQSPKEKVWGLLVSLDAAGVVLRGLDLAIFEEFLRQEVRHEDSLLGCVTLFYPMGRIERVERDDTVGPVLGYAERFERETGRGVAEAVGWTMTRRRAGRKTRR